MLAEEIGAYYADPLGFVLFNYPWRVPGTPLEKWDGPDKWQADLLDRWGKEIAKRGFDGVLPVAPVQLGISSGHGIGKSAFTAWAIDFIQSTRPFSKGVITANTREQLRTKTWAELAKWHKMGLTGRWFEITTGPVLQRYHKLHKETWRCDAQTCEERNSEAFAGLHAAGSTPFYIFDEASAVPNGIWEVAEGGLTDGEPFWLVFGNPTRGSGRFYDCFHRQRHRWITQQIDSRTARMTNKKKIQEWIDDWGEDSDFVRVRVRGVFPKASSAQLISFDWIERGRRETPRCLLTDPLILGVDVARFGDDESVLKLRKGRDARTHPQIIHRGLDTMQLAARIAELDERLRRRKEPIARIFIDGGGVGGGVVDRCRQLGLPVDEINLGETADDPSEYADKGAECWARMRDWLRDDSPSIEDDPVLHEQLTTREYGYDKKNRLRLESKRDLKARGEESPDRAEALALTFARHVAPMPPPGSLEAESRAATEYDPFDAL